MARNRIIYQSEALFVGPIAGGQASAHSHINRVQSISHDMSATRTDIYEFGRLAPLDKVMIEPPTVNLDFSYLCTNGDAEDKLGLCVAGHTSVTNVDKGKFGYNGTFPSMVSGLVDDGTVSPGEKNYYVVTVPESQDVNGVVMEAGDKRYNGYSVVGFGNGVISNYSVNGAVGDFPTASVSVEAFNVSFISGFKSDDADGFISGNAIPAVKKGDSKLMGGAFELPVPSTGSQNVFAVRPGDITLNFDTNNAGTAGSEGQLSVGGATLTDDTNEDPDSSLEKKGQAEPMHLQSFSIDAPLTRTALTRLGSTFPYYRAIEFPIDITLNTSAYLADVQTGSLVDLICDDQKRMIDINMRIPCTTSTARGPSETPITLKYRLKNAQLISQNFAAAIGDTKTVDLSFRAQYGGAQDTENGLFISGHANYTS